MADVDRDVVLALDSSTTAAKAVAWNARGEAVAEGRAAIALDNPTPGAWEQDAESWWTAACAAFGAATQALGTSGADRVGAVCIANQRETFVLTDPNGTPLRPAIVWMDARCRAEVPRTAERVGARRLLELTGKPPSTTPSLYKLLHLLRTEPSLRSAQPRFLDVHAYLAQRLTGRFATSLASADPLGVVDMQARAWSPELLALAGLDERSVPELVAPGAVLGAITSAAAQSTGLRAGLPVVAGAGDGQAAGIGAGITTLDRAYLNLGTAIVSGVSSERYVVDSAFRTLYGAREGTYFLETDLQGGTFTLTWLAERLLGRDADATVALGELEAAAHALPPGSDGLVAVPYFNGVMNPYWDDAASGVLLGLRGHHGAPHLYRAILEGLALEQRLHSSGVEGSTGTRIGELVVMGGGSRSDLFCQIVADATERSVVRAGSSEATALGAGILAAVAGGLHADLDAAVASMTSTGERFEPGASRARYRRLFDDVYRHVYPALRETMGRLVALEATP